MCARFSLTVTPEQIERTFRVAAGDLRSRANVAPSQDVPAVVEDRGGRRELRNFRWGLVPTWAKDPAIGSRLINARAESAAEKPSFRAAFRKRRCLIPASAFFEWKQLDDPQEEAPSPQPTLTGLGARRPAPRKRGPKIPYLFAIADQPTFALAGLWEVWHSPGDERLETCTILTTEPNELLSRFHNRMPCILEPDDFDQWLDRETEEAAPLLPLLTPFPAERMVCYPVNPALNNPRNEGPELLRPTGPLAEA